MRFYKVLIVLGIIGLFIAGLNTANQGLNCLTLENRGPVLGIRLEQKGISLLAFGKDYYYNQDKLDYIKDRVNQQILHLLQIIQYHTLKLNRYLNNCLSDFKLKLSHFPLREYSDSTGCLRSFVTTNHGTATK